MDNSKEPSKSELMRRLYDEGKTTNEISKGLGIRYQFVRNVVEHYKKTKLLNMPSNLPLSKEPKVAPVVSFKRKVGTGMFSRMNYQVKRGMQELYAVRSLSTAEWEDIKAFFNRACAYCGKSDTGDSRNGLVPDHLIAAADDGDFVIGNVVAACHDCNDRRGRKPWEKWLEIYFPDTALIRIAKISEYLVKYPYVTPPLGPASRLTPVELQEYEAIMQEWMQLNSRAVQLRDQIRFRRIADQ